MPFRVMRNGFLLNGIQLCSKSVMKTERDSFQIQFFRTSHVLMICVRAT